MKLEDLMVDTKSVWFDYPGCPGFKVKIATLSRKEMLAMRKNCMISEFDRKTRRPIETLDEDKFVSEFSKATIKGWKGFKIKYLEHLMPVDLRDNDPDLELDYSEDQAEALVQNSTEFDNWINEVVFDLENFRTGRTEKTVGETTELA